MIRFVADENFNNDIVRGLMRRVPGIDIVRVQDAGLTGADDPSVLEWVAHQDRIILTHDVSTLIGLAYERIRQGEGVPGVIAVPQSLAVGAAVEDLALIAECSSGDEWQDQVRYLPLR